MIGTTQSCQHGRKLSQFIFARCHSVDADDLFCRLDLPAEFTASAPRINPNLAVLVWGSAIGPSMRVADIRDFFPGPRELAQGPVGRIATMRELAKAADGTAG